MKRIEHTCFCVLLMAAGFYGNPLLAQTAVECKVEAPNLVGSYSGDCKNGYAHGKGEAKGLHRYIGQFKNGLPNGQGTYYYSDSVYHTGNFQAGIREGKGAAYYIRQGNADSVVKGYWSGGVYRGRTYITYSVADMPVFDRVEITPSDEIGNTITFETATTSGAVRGAVNSLTSDNGFNFSVSEVVALDGTFIQRRAEGNSIKYITTYQVSQFPVRLRVMLSNGKSFTLNLYKAANWKVALYLNM